MEFKRQVRKVDTSIVLTIPKDVVEYLELAHHEPVIIKIEEGKHGKFMSVFKPNNSEGDDVDDRENSE